MINVFTEIYERCTKFSANNDLATWRECGDAVTLIVEVPRYIICIYNPVLKSSSCIGGVNNVRWTSQVDICRNVHFIPKYGIDALFKYATKPADYIYKTLTKPLVFVCIDNDVYIIDGRVVTDYVRHKTINIIELIQRIHSVTRPVIVFEYDPKSRTVKKASTDITMSDSLLINHCTADMYRTKYKITIPDVESLNTRYVLTYYVDSMLYLTPDIRRPDMRKYPYTDVHVETCRETTPAERNFKKKFVVGARQIQKEICHAIDNDGGEDITAICSPEDLEKLYNFVVEIKAKHGLEIWDCFAKNYYTDIY
jgi:hypothetical protein